MFKIMVHCYSTDECINKFVIGYMINPSINCNKLFGVQVEKWLSVSFHSRTMGTIWDFPKNNSTCVMALIMIYENNGGNAKNIVYSVKLCCLLSHRQVCLYWIPIV